VVGFGDCVVYWFVECCGVGGGGIGVLVGVVWVVFVFEFCEYYEDVVGFFVGEFDVLVFVGFFGV